MKAILAVLATVLLITPYASAAAFTFEWNLETRALKDFEPVATMGNQSITLRNVTPAKPKDPPRLGVFVGDKQISKTPIYLDRTYYFTLVNDNGQTQLFLNGYPDAPPFPFALAGDKTLNGDNHEYNAEAYKADDVLSRFKKKIHQRIATAAIVTVGHRGDNHGSPENTNISYVNAIANKTPIEMDLRLTKDNVLVLLHDATVNRTSNGKGPIVEMTLEDAQKLDAGTWKDAKYKGEKIPKVEDICQTCRDKAVMMLDLKCTGLGPSLAELKQKTNFPSDSWVLAPWEEAEGTELRKYLPDVPMILLHGKLPEKYDDAYFDHMKKIGFSWFSLNWQIITQDFIDAAHKHDMKIYLWTVNDPADVAGGVLAGVDGLITDNVPSTMKIVADLTEKK